MTHRKAIFSIMQSKGFLKDPGYQLLVFENLACPSEHFPDIPTINAIGDVLKGAATKLSCQAQSIAGRKWMLENVSCRN